MGEFSKIIFLGDPNQSDLPSTKTGGFSKLCKLFADEESENHGIFHFKFTKEGSVEITVNYYNMIEAQLFSGNNVAIPSKDNTKILTKLAGQSPVVIDLLDEYEVLKNKYEELDEKIKNKS